MAESMSLGGTARLPERRAWREGRWVCCSARGSQSMEDRNNKVSKELGFFSFKKKIEDAVSRAQMIASAALEAEEARRVEQEEVLLRYNLWDDPTRSSESLRRLSNATKAVNALKDLQYKAEEAKLITELAEMDSINHQLFKQAYDASVDVNKFLDQYEMSKLLTGPYDREGACVTITAESEDIASQMWAEKLVRMYTRWSGRHGYEARVVERVSSQGIGVSLATIELESEYVYGYLSGETGAHLMINNSSSNGSTSQEAISAAVDVIPLFLESTAELHVDEADLEISSPSRHDGAPSGHEMGSAVAIRHIPTGIIVQCSGERSRFANKMKALNRLRAKLLVISREQQEAANPNGIRKPEVRRRYLLRPQRLVQDVKTGVQLPGLNSILDGNIEPLIRAHISLRRGRYPEF